MDARVRYTKKIIRDTFIEMLREKRLSKITVKEICERAEINRATFYKYYENPYHLLEMLETEQIDKLQEEINKRKTSTLPELFRVVLTEIIDNFEIYQVMFSENGDGTFRERVFACLYEENMKIIGVFFPDMPAKKQEWLFYYIATGCIGVLNKWMEDGGEKPLDEVIDFVCTIIDNMNRTLPGAFN